MVDSSSFPFNNFINERANKFADLYASLIIYDQITGYVNLYHILQKSRKLMNGEEFNHQSLNQCISGIDKFYSSSVLEKRIKQMINSVTLLLSKERFEYFRAKLPKDNLLIDRCLLTKDKIKLMKEKLHITFNNYFEQLKYLKNIDLLIQRMIVEIYLQKRTDILPDKRSKVAKIGPVIFANSGSIIRDAFAGSVMGKSNQVELIFKCMNYISQYVDRAESIYEMILSSSQDIKLAFKKVNQLLIASEMQLYQELQKKVEKDEDKMRLDQLFINYYSNEIKALDQIYQKSIIENNISITFAEIVKRVEAVIGGDDPVEHKAA